MKIIKPTTKRRKVIIIASILGALFLLSLAAIYTYQTKSGYFGFYPFGRHISESINLQPPTDEEIDAGTDTKNDTITDGGTKPGNSQNSGNDDTDQSTGSEIPVNITSAQQFDTIARIRVYIDQLTAQGTCKLTLSGPNGGSYTEQVAVQPLSTYTTCKGFDVETSKLSVGSWTINVEFTSDSSYGKATSTIDIK